MKNAAYMIFAALSCLSLCGAMALAFVHAPVDANMGVVQKIFYFHVPAAYSTYLAWATCTVASIAYLVRRTERWDMLAKSAAELALLFALVVMTTGPLWGRKSWGAYWTWDPRLTSTLLLTLIILSYVLLRSLTSGEVERRFSAALSILGACILPIIHLAVHKWRGQHPTVITGKGGGLDPSMRTALMVALLAFTLFFVALLIGRYGLEKSQRRLERLQQEAAAQGLGQGAEP